MQPKAFDQLPAKKFELEKKPHQNQALVITNTCRTPALPRRLSCLKKLSPSAKRGGGDRQAVALVGHQRPIGIPTDKIARIVEIK